MTYKLRSGYTVRTTRVGNNIDFETKNRLGETVSTIQLDHSAASAMVRSLQGREL